MTCFVALPRQFIPSRHPHVEAVFPSSSCFSSSSSRSSHRNFPPTKPLNHHHHRRRDSKNLFSLDWLRSRASGISVLLFLCKRFFRSTPRPRGQPKDRHTGTARHINLSSSRCYGSESTSSAGRCSALLCSRLVGCSPLDGA